MVGRVPALLPGWSGSIPGGVGNFNFSPGPGCVLSLAVNVTFCRHRFQGGPHLCICLVFWSKVCASSTGIWTHEHWIISDRGVRPTFIIIVIIIIIILNNIIRVFCPRAGPSLQAHEPGLQFCRRLQFYQGLNTCGSFLHSSISLASEQTSKDLKRSQGHQHGGEESRFG